jgi:predicted DNA-binding protein with PD1-like motif
VCAGKTDRAVDQSPISVNPMGQEHRIFIFRLHDQTKAFKVVEIFRERQGHTWTVACVGSVNHGILF